MSFGEHCPVCGGGNSEELLALGDVPVHIAVLWPSAEAARACPTGSVELSVCHGCGHIFNSAFDPMRVDYELDYENSLRHSKVFQEYERGLARRLVDSYGLRRRRLIEIGCGDAALLGLLCDLGDNWGIGYDPSASEARTATAAGSSKVTVVRDYFRPETTRGEAGLLVCRHVLEHVADPVTFLAAMGSIPGRPIVYVEVPNTDHIMRNFSIWEVIYEHVGYFTASSLRACCARAGLQVEELGTAFEGEFLWVDAQAQPLSGRASVSGPDGSDVVTQLRAFANRFESSRRLWSDAVKALFADGQRIALWGAGARGASFLNLVDDGEPMVDTVIDINPRKQGSFVGRTGHAIEAPEILVDRRPDVVIVLNPVYEDEVSGQLASMGIDAPIVSALSDNAVVKLGASSG